MFGVDFINGHNSLIVLGAEFSVRNTNHMDAIYKWNAGPEGERLLVKNQTTDEWENAEKPLDDILPSSFGLDWKQRDFILALSFWCEGQRASKES